MVVGGLGYIGSHTALELLNSGFNVLVIDNLCNSFESTLSSIAKLAVDYSCSNDRALPCLQFHKLDYRSPSMQSILKTYSQSISPSLARATSEVSSAGPKRLREQDCDNSLPRQEKAHTRYTESTSPSRISGVIHFAAYKAVEESIRSPLSYYQNNVCGLVDFLVLLRSHNITNFVFSSSATVYGSKTNDGIPLREEDLVHHPEIFIRNGKEELLLPGVKGLSSPYGRTKYFCEAILADVAHADPEWKIIALRYFNPVGCHESGLLGEEPRQIPSNLFPVLSSKIVNNGVLDIFGDDWDTEDGTPVRDFIHVVDLAKGHIAALAASAKRPGEKGSVAHSFRAFNLGTGKGSSVQEVVEMFETVLGRKIPVQIVGRRAGDVGFCVAATGRVEREFGWKCERSLSKGVEDTWNSICKSKGVVVRE